MIPKLTAGASALVITLLSGAAVLAQQSPAAPPAAEVTPQTSPTAPTPSARSGPQTPTEQQIIDEINARIAQMKANLRLTDAQGPHWPALETAMREVRLQRAKDAIARQTRNWQEREAYRERMRAWREDRNRGVDGMSPPPRPRETRESDIAAMREMANAMAVRSAQLSRIADAAGPLYDSLDERQRERLMRGMRMVGERGMRGMQGMREGRRDRDDDWDD